jgi:2'-5' RNA ligase
VPAHITLLYPFKPPDEIGYAVLENLGRGFSRFGAFRFSLAHVRRFPAEVLYLAPQPDEPFRQLTSAIRGWYPETPPYAGKWPEIIPHLTVANLVDEEKLDRVADEFARAAHAKLPIDATAAEVALMDNCSGRWQVRATLGLGRAMV